jgi:electron transfer flavoprotein beta subunit
MDAITVAKELKNHIEANSYDVIICGQESIDYNGQQVPAMLAAMLRLPFANACVGLSIQNSTATATYEATLPMVIGGKKGLVEEKDLRIPNMRGIMSARTKPLEVVASSETGGLTSAVAFEKPAGKAEVKMVDADNVDELVRLLHEEAKAI